MKNVNVNTPCLMTGTTQNLYWTV